MTFYNEPPHLEETWYQHSEALSRQLEGERAARLATYRQTPHDVDEHVGIETSIAQGGYANRQIHELVQNGADAIYKGDASHGWVEVRLTSTHLYVANTGATLDTHGLQTLLHAHISRKRSGEIGRFGVGFKAVLKVSQQPQIFSRTLCMGFDNARTLNTLQSEINPQIQHAPTLRLAWTLDPEAQDDEHLEQMMQWASSIVRLPLTQSRDVETLRQEMSRFDASFLLFAPTSLSLTFCDLTQDVSNTRQMHSTRKADSNTWELIDGQHHSTWTIASTSLDLGADSAAMEDAGVRHRRDTYEVHWAIPHESRLLHRPGRFWVFFPLREPAPVPGILSAPWKTSDDRQHMLPGTFNEALLRKTAAWMTTQYEAHFNAAHPEHVADLLPWTSMETWASQTLSACLQDTLSGAKIWANAANQSVEHQQLILHPRDVSVDLILLWHELYAKQTHHWPHPAYFSTPERRARFEHFFGPEQDREFVDWLEDVRGAEAANLRFYIDVWTSMAASRDSLLLAQILPCADGRFVHPKHPKLFLPMDESFDWLNDLRFVPKTFTDHINVLSFLKDALHLREPSREDVLGAMNDVVAPLYDNDEHDLVWSWLDRVPEIWRVDFAQSRANNASKMLYAPTQAHGWQPSTMAYISQVETGPWHIDQTFVSAHATLLHAAGFHIRLVDAALIWSEDASDTQSFIPLGPLMEGADVQDNLLMTDTVLCQSVDVELDDRFLALLRENGVCSVANHHIKWGSLTQNLPARWSILHWKSNVNWSDTMFAHTALEPQLAQWPEATWHLFYQLVQSCEDQKTREAFYAQAFDYCSAPNLIRIGDDVLPRAQVMVTGNEALASTATSLGWPVLMVSRVGRINAMRVGMKLLTGVPKMEAAEILIQGRFEYVLPDVHFWLNTEAFAQQARVVLCHQLQEVMLSTKGRHGLDIEHAWHKNTLYIKVSPGASMGDVNQKALNAFASLDMVSDAAISNALCCLAPHTHTHDEQWQSLWQDGPFAGNAQAIRYLQSILVPFAKNAIELDVLALVALAWSTFGDGLMAHLPSLLASAQMRCPVLSVKDAARVLGFTVQDANTTSFDTYFKQNSQQIQAHNTRLCLVPTSSHATWLTRALQRIGVVAKYPRPMESLHLHNHLVHVLPMDEARQRRGLDELPFDQVLCWDIQAPDDVFEHTMDWRLPVAQSSPLEDDSLDGLVAQLNQVNTPVVIVCADLEEAGLCARALDLSGVTCVMATSWINSASNVSIATVDILPAGIEAIAAPLIIQTSQATSSVSASIWRQCIPDGFHKHITIDFDCLE